MKKIYALSLAGLLLLTGCASANAPSAEVAVSERQYNSSFDKGTASAPMAAPAPMDTRAPESEQYLADQVAGGTGGGMIQPYEGGGNTIGKPDAQMKIIRRVWMQTISKNFDADVAAITAAVNQGGGFVESSNISGRKPVQWNEPGRTASLTLRIPQDNLEWFLDFAATVGEVEQQQIGSEDVTATYYDTETRVETLKIQLERLESILAKSDELADVLALETEIARVRYEIESLTTTLRHYDRMVAYSTVSIDVREQTDLTRPETANPLLGERMSRALSRSYNGTIDFLESLLVGAVALLPALIILLPVALIVLLIIRLCVKAGKRAEERRKAEIAERREAGIAAPAATTGFSAPPRQPSQGGGEESGK